MPRFFTPAQGGLKALLCAIFWHRYYAMPFREVIAICCWRCGMAEEMCPECHNTGRMESIGDREVPCQEVHRIKATDVKRRTGSHLRFIPMGKFIGVYRNGRLEKMR